MLLMNNKLKIQFMIVTIAVVILSLLYFLFPVANYRFFPKCIFHELTGLYCPGCGSQRAFSALLHGDLLLALHDNLLMVCSIPLLIYSAYIFTWNTFHQQKKRQRFFYSPAFVKSFLLLLIAFAVLRNINLSPFNLLAPVL